MKWNQLTKKRKWILIGAIVIVASILVCFGIMILTTKKEDKLPQALNQINSKILIEASIEKKDVITGIYQYDQENSITYFRLFTTEEELEKVYYDAKNKKLYEQNTITKIYKQIDYETTSSMQSVIWNTLLDSDGIPRRSNDVYLIPRRVISNLFEDQDNLLMAYFKKQQISPLEEQTTAKVTYLDDKFSTISYQIPTNQGELKIELTFQDTEESFTLPNVEVENEQEKLSAQWIIIGLQKIYKDEDQITKGVTDVDYFMSSSIYKELQEKITVKPAEVRLRINPSTVKESGIITGTITFENGVVVTIDRNVVVD